MGRYENLLKEIAITGEIQSSTSFILFSLVVMSHVKWDFWTALSVVCYRFEWRFSMIKFKLRIVELEWPREGYLPDVAITLLMREICRLLSIPRVRSMIKPSLREKFIQAYYPPTPNVHFIE